MARSERVNSAIHRTAGEVKRYRTFMRVGPVLIGLLILLVVLLYIIAALYSRYGSFTVTVNKFDSLKYALTLSETEGFETGVSRLNCKASEQVTNISGKSLPDWLDNVDGEHNGQNYVAYTFYCKNAGTETVSYVYELYVTNTTDNIEKAIRVRLYVNGEYEDYAYPRTDGVEGPEPGTTAFLMGNTIVRREIRGFAPGDVTKYTVVIWLEGDDPDCLDNIIGGEFKVDMSLSILATEETGEFAD